MSDHVYSFCSIAFCGRSMLVRLPGLPSPGGHLGGVDGQHCGGCDVHRAGAGGGCRRQTAADAGPDLARPADGEAGPGRADRLHRRDGDGWAGAGGRAAGRGGRGAGGLRRVHDPARLGGEAGCPDWKVGVVEDLIALACAGFAMHVVTN